MEKLNKNIKKIKVELHVHTKFSHDSMLPFLLLYLKCRFCKIDYIAITEHNNILGALNFKKYCLKKGNKIKVIIGEEIMTSSGEIIGLFLNRAIKSGLTPKETIKEILLQNGVVYIPHPYDEKRYKTVLKEIYIEKYKDIIHCIEIHNGRNISEKYDKKQYEIATKYGIQPIIGSDAHTVFEIGRNYLFLNSKIDTSEDFLKAIKFAEFHSKKCLVFCHYITRFARVISFIKKGDFYGLLRIIYRKIK